MSVDDTQPLISHLIELRKRILNSLMTILVVFLSLVYFSNDIYQLIAAPLMDQLPKGSNMIATDVASPFFYTDQTDSDGVCLYVGTHDPLSSMGIYCSGVI